LGIRLANQQLECIGQTVSVDNSLSQLTPQDLQAIAVYLKETKPIARGPLIDPNPPSLAASSFAAPGAAEPSAAAGTLSAAPESVVSGVMPLPPRC